MARIRILAAFLLVAMAWGGALYLHSLRTTRHHPSYRSCPGGCFVGNRAVIYPAYTTDDRPAWADPAALALTIGSLGIGAALLPFRR